MQSARGKEGKKKTQILKKNRQINFQLFSSSFHEKRKASFYACVSHSSDSIEWQSREKKNCGKSF